MSLINPFVPFIADQSTDNGLESSAYHDALGHVAGYIQHIGNSTLISDELGRHVQTLQHLSNGVTVVQDALGHSEGQLHHGLNHVAVLSDSLGHMPRLSSRAIKRWRNSWLRTSLIYLLSPRV